MNETGHDTRSLQSDAGLGLPITKLSPSSSQKLQEPNGERLPTSPSPLRSTS